jgi:hypothetical protein
MSQSANDEAVHKKLMDWLRAEVAKQQTNRKMMAKCEDFYDGRQYEPHVIRELKERGQKPVVYNEIKTIIDWHIGNERKSRVDFLVTATEPGEEADEDAQLKTRLMKYLDQCNRASFERSYAFEDSLKAGIGWMEIGLRGNDAEPEVFIGHESWRNIVHDSRASRRDLSDGRFMFRIKTVDMDVALAMFPNKKVELEQSRLGGSGGGGRVSSVVFAGMFGDAFGEIASNDATGLDWASPEYGQTFDERERVTLIECWSREPVASKQNKDGLADGVSWGVHCTLMTDRFILQRFVSPFKHGRFPFVPVWAYRNRRTGLPYSPIYPLMGPQEAFNLRMGRSLYEASSNQVEIEIGAVDPEIMSLDELRKELDDPNGMAVYANGALTGNKVRSRESKSNAQFQLQLAQEDLQMMRSGSGVTSENRGLNSNATSGKAVLAKAEQGTTVTMELADNLLYARQLEGEMVLSLAEQFMAQPMAVRLTGEEKNEVHEMNTHAGNDITARRAKFVVGEQAWKQSFAESTFEGLMQMLTQLASTAPEMVMALMDVVFEMHPNLPRKEEILKRIRAVNGQSASGQEPDPQQAQQQAQQQQMQLQQQQMALEQQQAQMQKLLADIAQTKAKTEQMNAQAVTQRIEGMYMSAQAGQVLGQMPSAVPIADELLKSAGFEDLHPDAPLPVPPSMSSEAMPMTPEPLQQTDGLMQGIETPDADGIR